MSIEELVPKRLRALIGEVSTWSPVSVGKSGDACFLVKISSGSEAYLKLHTGVEGKYFAREVSALGWLKTFVPVPQVLEHDDHFLLCSALPGKNLVSCIGEIPAPEIVRLCAQAMRLLHNIPVDKCFLNQRLSVKVKLAEERAAQGQIDLDDLDSSRQGWTAQGLKKELVEGMPSSEDVVVTHGDFCLPNIISQDGEFAGFVDLGRCGLADRHQDIALCLRSLKDNLGESFHKQFLKEYEYKGPLDYSKVLFYELLDEFF